MPSFIPTYFDRIRTTKIACANGGWVYVRPLRGGDRYYITANGRRAETVDRHNVYHVVRDIVNSMGGTVPYAPGPNPNRFEQAQTIVNNLLETDPDDPDTFIQREVERRSEPIKKLKIIGRRWFRHGPGTTYHSAYIYINDKLVHVIPFAYGYGDQYLWNAFDWLERNGYVDKTQNEPPWVTAERMGIQLDYNAVDVPRKRDL